MATIQELLAFGKDQLDKSGNENAKYERRVLLEEVLGQNYMYMLLNGNEEVLADVEKKYMEFLEKRCTHYPLQYLLGYAHFMDYVFYVDENVLIPRSDTEILTECANDIIEQQSVGNPQISVLDLCCGSGCIGISLKLYHRQIKLLLSDISESALSVAKRNLSKYELEAETFCGDLFECLSTHVDMIVSNPPYIEHDRIDKLMPEVREYEPRTALDGGRDGLSFYRRIIDGAPNYLSSGGWLLFEIGCDQGDAVKELMIQNGFRDVVVKKDYANLDRVVYGHL